MQSAYLTYTSIIKQQTLSDRSVFDQAIPSLTLFG